MMKSRNERPVRRRSALAAVTLAATVIAALLAFSSTAASAESKDLSLGDRVTFSDGSPAVGVKVTLYEAETQWKRGLFLGRALTDNNGNYRIDVDQGCYITVAVAPLGAEFDFLGSGKVYDQTFGCVENGPNNDFDSVLYREDTKPPPTTTPPTTAPPTTPTTAPPTTLPPTTLPPTTAPPKTTTTVAPTTTTTAPTTTTTAKECRKVDRKAYWNQWGKGFSWSGYPSELGLSEFDGVDLRPVYRVLDRIGTRTHSQAGVDTHTGLINILVYYDRTNNNPIEYPSQLELVFKDGKKKVHVCFHVRLTMSPIGLDVDGSGAVERISADVAFDFDADGETETVSEWFAPTEGILFDTRIEGPITGEHLFGDQAGTYADGFEKLALLDANTDGHVSGAELDGLAIWTDANSNGILDSGEQSSLADHGVVSLSTSHTNMVSTAALADGSTMMTEDLWFPTTAAAAARNTVQVIVLSGAGLALLAYAAFASRRRRDGLDAELAAMVNSESNMS